jgi:hypothetical protein
MWWPRVESAVNVAKRENKQVNIVVLGHSLGAAAAQLGAYRIYSWLKVLDQAPPFRVRATTFNSPALGNDEMRTQYQVALQAECSRGKLSCLSLHQFERRSDVVHDLPGLSFWHPVWQTDNEDATFGRGPYKGAVGGDKSMYWGSSFLTEKTSALPEGISSHLMKFWRHDAKVMSDNVLRSMRYL